MTEYGMPMGGPVTMYAEVTRPNNTTTTLSLVEGDTGIFTGSMQAALAGVYTFRILASGKTLRGRDFTREQTLTGVTWKGGDNPPPSTTDPRPGDDERRRCCKWVLSLIGLGLLLLLVLIFLLL
jgi:hypothetical protein